MPAKAVQFAARLLFVCLIVCFSITNVSGQNNNNNNNNNNNSGVAGIDIDADGVLRVRQSDPALAEAQRKAAIQKRGVNGTKTSAMRKVSLQRLEQSVASTLSSGSDISFEQLTLAGLTRVEYVIYFPGSKDIVIAGPAEEVIENPDGRPVGLTSGHPTVRLDDLVVALRAFASGNGKADFVSCSIDPTPAGLAKMQNFLKQLGGSIPPNSDVRNIARGMQNSLGMQTVSIHGVPATTRFAQTLVEADYRMKLIGIGLERPAIQLKSWVARANPSSGSASSMQRWYFTADYSGVKVSPDSSVLKLEGRGVKLVGEDERVDRSGNRTKSNKAADPASQGFTKEFTEKFEKLADVTPVFYDMRNLFDLSVCAAFIQEQGFCNLAGWNLGAFGDESRFKVEIASAPLQVETAVNAIWRGSRLMTPIGGGVHISARKVASGELTEQDSKLSETQSQASAPKSLAADQWWWD
jgi:Protein of unknown function (DUF1598)